MASLIQRAKSRFWVACYRGQMGKRCQRSTMTSDKAVALKMAIEWERVERLGLEGQASTFQFQKIVNEVSAQITGETLPSPTVTEYFAEWLLSIKKKNTPSTIERYGNSVRLFLEALGPVARQPLRGLCPKHIEQFLRRRLDSGVAPKTVIIDVKTISCALRRAESFNYLDKNPAPAVRLPKNVGSAREEFTSDEVQRILAAAPNQEWQTLILLGFYLGARLGDCVTMRWDNVHADKGLLVYVQKKTGRRMVMPMHLHLLRHLVQIADHRNGEFLCPSLAAKTPGGQARAFRKLQTDRAPRGHRPHGREGQRHPQLHPPNLSFAAAQLHLAYGE
jgi:integrase